MTTIIMYNKIEIIFLIASQIDFLFVILTPPLYNELYFAVSFVLLLSRL